MLGENGKRLLVATVLMVAALVFLSGLGGQDPAKAAAEHPGSRPAERQVGSDTGAGGSGKESTRQKPKRQEIARKPGRSKGQLLNEAKRVFGKAEAARAKKLAESFGSEGANYLYVVEQPSEGEVQTVKAQIADLRNEVTAEDREDFDKRLQEQIASYDPYGEKERKAFLITVPLEGAKRMSGTILEADNIEEVREKLISGESVHIRTRQMFVASYDGTTLDRFDQLMVWDPEKPE